ncbi:MAG: LysR family transcriptional regulator [Clostridia bacterium]|nr:LysR family transcriptional regulator [Clostridia bacterium]
MIRQMRYFIAVVESGNFGEAGEVCHISQSAISQQIQALENELDVKLLDRHGRKFDVTPAGQYFYQRSKQQIGEIESLIREVRRIGKGEHQNLRIGVLNGFSSKLMQSAIGTFAPEHPNVTMSLRTGTHEEIFQWLLAGQLDMVINDQRRALSDQWFNEFLMDQQVYALVRQDVVEANPGGIELGDLKPMQCILVAGPEYLEAEVSYWRDVVGLSSDILFTENMDTALMNVSTGAGFLPCDHDVPSQGGNVRLPILRSGVPLTRKMYAFWPEQADFSLQKEFSDMLRTHIQ